MVPWYLVCRNVVEKYLAAIYYVIYEVEGFSKAEGVGESRGRKTK